MRGRINPAHNPVLTNLSIGTRLPTNLTDQQFCETLISQNSDELVG